MRKISLLATILITSFVMTLSGLGASPVATASENESVRVSSRFAFGSSLLSKAQKVEIEKAVTTSGVDATFLVTGVAGKLPGVSDSKVQLLAKKRAQTVKSHLVQLGVNKASVAVKVKITRPGIVPKTRFVGTFASPVLATPTPAPTPTPTPTVAQTCAAGGSCLVGDTGPGGGIVYYVDNTGFSCGADFTSTGSPTSGLCKYLEVAPSDWNTGADPQKVWAATAENQGIDVSGITNETTANNSSTGLGLGLKNSIAIVTQNGAYNASINDYAAGAARAYTNNSKSDWYLPTTAELNLLCQWGRNITQVAETTCTGGTLNSGTGVNGGFVTGEVSFYWSSSEYNAIYSWFQDFEDSYQDGNRKFAEVHVRPVRAF